MDDNVLQMPTLLERLANKLQTCLKQEHTNRQEWIAIQEAKCATLVEIRDQFAANAEFGRWCDENGFGKAVINQTTRAYAIVMGRSPELLRQCLQETERESLETIFRFEFSRLMNVHKTPVSIHKTRNLPLRQRNITAKITNARKAVRAAMEDGEPVLGKLVDELGVSKTTVQVAAALEQGRIEGLNEAKEIEPIDPAEMKPTTKQRYEAALKKARAELREEITAEVCAAYQDMVTWNRERVARADRIIASHRGVMSRDAFRKVKACLHPDHNTFKFAAEALQTFSELESVLVKPEDAAPVASGLPKTAAELMARRRQHRQ